MELCRGIHLCRESLADKLYQNVPSFYFDTENSYYAEFPKENMFVALIVNRIQMDQLQFTSYSNTLK